MTQRWKITIEYDGTDFVGWQRQDIDPSVQSVLEEAIFNFTGENIIVHGAGRTDSGVHALGQVAHFDVTKDYEPHAVRNAINVHARPHLVAVTKAEPVSQEFHARFNAVKRHYRYVICNRPAPVVIGKRYAWHIGRPLDVEAMRKAATLFIGQHDFTSFRATVCQAKSPVRTLEKIEIIEDGDNIYFDFSAPGFLHHQVRNIVGTLRKVGDGSWPWDCITGILEARNRIAGGPTAPPDGLFFMRVDYNDNGNK